MADAFGLAVTVGQILAALYDYGKSAKEARDDINKLSLELFALKGTLEYVDQQKDTRLLDPAGVEVLQRTRSFLDALLTELTVPRSKARRLLQSLKWPLDQDDMKKHLARLERVKSWLILAFMTGTSADTTAIYKTVQELSRDVHADIAIRQQKDSQREATDLLRWLSPVSHADQHARVCQKRQPGSGGWLVDGPLHPWLDGSTRQVMCLRGKSGCGKSTLLSWAIDATQIHCQKDDTTSCAFFYCSFQDASTHQIANILGSIAAQLAEQDSTLLQTFQSFYDETQHLAHRPPVKISDLERILGQSLMGASTKYILVDAINELPDETELLTSLARLMDISPNLRLFVTSTADLANSSISPATLRTIQVEQQDTVTDISILLDHTLQEDPALRSLSVSLKQEIRQTLMTTSDGSFRWVHLSLENLRTKRSPRAIREALKALPESLQESYEAILLRIPKDDREVARSALFWLSFSVRPLSLAELNEAIMLEDEQTSVDDDSRLSQDDLILRLCQGLIEVQANDSQEYDLLSKPTMLVLGHSSVKTYLTSPDILTSHASFFALPTSSGDATLMRKCLQYLSLTHFHAGYIASASALADLQTEYPLLRYAAFCWALHAASTTPTSPEDKDLILRFLATKQLHNGGNFALWVQLLIPDVDRASVERTQPLYYAASFGLTAVVATILESAKRDGVDIDALGGRFGSTPLFVACWREHLDVARLLFDAGADTEGRDSSGFTVASLVGERARRARRLNGEGYGLYGGGWVELEERFGLEQQAGKEDAETSV